MPVKMKLCWGMDIVCCFHCLWGLLSSVEVTLGLEVFVPVFDEQIQDRDI